MAKRDDYPANKSIRARLDCLIQSHSTLRSLVRSIRDVVLPDASGKVKDVVGQQVAEALAAAEVAGQAISGFDDE